MADIGYFSLLVSFLVSIYGVIISLMAAYNKRLDFYFSAVNSMYALLLTLTMVSSSLIYGLLTHDFRLQYVASYTNKTLPKIYSLSAFWAGQEGSLLLWVWVLSIFGAIVVYQNRDKSRELIPYVISIISIVALFFNSILVFGSNPLARLPYPPLDGQGLNPMLQNPGMFFHPPTLYLGFVGFTIPYAFAISALITKRLDDDWIRSTRRWTLISWFFLGMGNIIGAWWAYVTLGWGGYWAWDPVENASLMPWLLATAFLHSVMIQEKRDMLKVWNMVLVILTFTMTLFGTFITRSGIISSVHSFAQSYLGPVFLLLMVIIIFFSFGLLIFRINLLRSINVLDSLISKESSFLINNLILVGAAFTVLWGTLFPVISEAVRGVKISVGPPFFNTVIIPIGLALLIITGICPLIAWRKASISHIERNFFFPAIISIAGGIVFFFYGVRHIYALISFIISIFVLITIALEFIRGTIARHKMAQENHIKAFINIINRNKRRYGGYVIHIGIVLMFIGITGSAFNVETQATVNKGDIIKIKDYSLKYENNSFFPTQNKEVFSTTLSIYKMGKFIGNLRPQKDFYKTQEQPWTRVAIRSSFKEDLYIILAGYEKDGQATFKVVVNPLVIWIWIGGTIIAFGSLIILIPDRKGRSISGVKYVTENI